MIISSTPNQLVSSRLLMLAFIFALSLPLGASGAEDKKAQPKSSPKDLYKQIEAAVAAGKITKEEAQAKLKALKTQHAPKGEAKSSPKDLYKLIEAAVKAGKITKEEAQAKLKALKTQGAPKGEAIKKGDDKKTIAHLENIWAELQSLVGSGKMSADEAASVISTIKQKVFAKTSANVKKANIKSSPKDLYKQIEAAVIAGKITKEEAQAKLKALNPKGSPKKNVKGSKEEGSPKTAAQGKKAVTEANLKEVWTELQAAVAAGKLTKAEAVAKMRAIKKAKLSGK